MSRSLYTSCPASVNMYLMHQTVLVDHAPPRPHTHTHTSAGVRPAVAPDRYGDGAVAAGCIHACLPRLTLTLRLRPAALHLPRLVHSYSYTS